MCRDFKLGGKLLGRYTMSEDRIHKYTMVPSFVNVHDRGTVELDWASYINLVNKTVDISL